MNPNRDQLYFSPPKFSERHNDSFAKDRDIVLGLMRGLRAKIEHIKRSGHYSPKGEATEIDAAIAATQKELAPTRKIIDRITLSSRRATKPSHRSRTTKTRWSASSGYRPSVNCSNAKPHWTRGRINGTP